MRRREAPGALRPLRIAHVITRLLNGGADENTVISCNHAVRSGHDVILVHGAETHPEILATVDEAKAGIIDGSLDMFAGPISDNAGNIVIAEGETVPFAERTECCQWLVEGVTGEIPS